MTDFHDVRRHPDGSIDFDFYRARATALRRQAIREAFALKTVGRSLLTIAGALAAATIIASIPAGLI